MLVECGMAVAEKNRQETKFLNFDGGVDTGSAPDVILDNQVSDAINTTVRGGRPTCRPPFTRRRLAFNYTTFTIQGKVVTGTFKSGETVTQTGTGATLKVSGNQAVGNLLSTVSLTGTPNATGIWTGATSGATFAPSGPPLDTRTTFEDGFFQGASTFRSPFGRVFLVAAIGGNLYATEILANFETTQLVIPGNQNNPNLQKAWFVQAENTLIVQDNESRPVFWDGSILRRAEDNEVPVGGPIAYGQGRVWVARGRTYAGGDIVNGDLDYGIDNVLRFTENEFLNEGGAFSVPRTDTDVVGLNFVAAQNEAFAVSGLMVGTRGGIYQFDAPSDRELWKNLEQPLQRFALLEYGTMSHESMTNVNGDLFFRSIDGVRSFKYAQRVFEGWGNTPISDEVTKPIKYDADILLDHCSAVNFDNRLLVTTMPTLSKHGVWHVGMVALDFKLLAKMNRQGIPVWEGTWTGLRVLQLVTAYVHGTKRCFAYALDADMRICLYELELAGPQDNGTTNIKWTITSREYSPSGQMLWELSTADFWFTDVQGQYTADFFYRADQVPCWQKWHDQTECVTNCFPGQSIPCDAWPLYQPMTLPRRSLPAPDSAADYQLKRPHRQGYGFQLRMEFSGKFTLSKGRIVTSAVAETIVGTVIPSRECP